jgi:hypothetical protein
MLLRAVDEHGERLFDYALWVVFAVLAFAMFMYAGLSLYMAATP